MRRTRLFLLWFQIVSLSTAVCLQPARGADPSPAVIGWGNVIVPGFGATMRGYPERGLIEAVGEVGLYYGSTFGAHEGDFTIDGSVLLPKSNVYRPLISQILQEAGLKLHMYDTFYHYQQAALAIADSDREKSNPQPLYKGTLSDQLTAPFKWKNLETPWVYALILASAAYLTYSYATTTVPLISYRATPSEDALYGISQIAVIPFGSVLGEEAFFRGFVQREMRLYTNSAVAAVLIESAFFTLIHPRALMPSAAASGIYFGIMVNHFEGDIEQTIAAHFWVNVIDGVMSYLQFRRSQGIGTPLNPPVMGMKLSFPF